MTDNLDPEIILNVNKAWLPPHPHIDRIVEMVSLGRAHIEHRGHELPPLVVFEDGGVIELPDVRYQDTHRGIEIVSASAGTDKSETKHPDVCGCIDELRGLVDGNINSISDDPERFRRLIIDALYMIERMRKRIDAYNSFFNEVASVCETEASISNPENAAEAAGRVNAIINDASSGKMPDVSELFDFAEKIRDVAGRQEAALYAMRDLSIRISSLYKEIKGARNWKE